jgi:hypothetical protein
VVGAQGGDGGLAGGDAELHQARAREALPRLPWRRLRRRGVLRHHPADTPASCRGDAALGTIARARDYAQNRHAQPAQPARGAR